MAYYVGYAAAADPATSNEDEDEGGFTIATFASEQAAVAFAIKAVKVGNEVEAVGEAGSGEPKYLHSDIVAMIDSENRQSAAAERQSGI